MATNENKPGPSRAPDLSRAQGPGRKPTQSSGKAAPRKKRRKRRTPWQMLGGGLLGVLKFFVVIGCICVMIGSVAAVLVSQYVVTATENDADMLNLDQIKLNYTTHFYAQNPNTGEWEDYASLSSDQQRTWVDLTEIPENLQNAFIAVEDKDFRSHSGVNYKRTFSAAVNLVLQKVSGGAIGLYDSMQGASTITQQLIKNITGDDETDPLRKVREVFRAIGLENRYSKDMILEAYLNTISLTGNLAGVQSGAEYYFGKDVRDLTLAECASIACVTKSPTSYNPITNPANHVQRRNHVLGLMYEQGLITQEEYEEAKNAPLVLTEEQPEEVATHTSHNSWYTDAALDEIIPLIREREGFETDAEAYRFFTTEGFNVYLNVNPYMQEEMEKLMLNTDGTFADLPIEVEDADGVLQEGEEWATDENGAQKYASNGNPIKIIKTNAAMVTIDNDNGKVLAIAGGLREKTADRVLNRALTQHQVGSTMKPIGAYALGIEYRLTHYSDAWPDIPYQQIEDPERPGQMKDWPTNYGGSYSNTNVLLYKALAKSLNTVPVHIIGDYVGVDNVFSFMHDTLNMTNLVSPSENAQFNDAALSPLALGALTEGVTPLEMAAAYQMFSNGGAYHSPTFFASIQYPNGEVYMESTPTTVQALSSEAAMVMNRLLRNPVADPEGTAAGIGSQIAGMEIIAKTGTTQDWKDFTFVGGTPYYTTALWYGYDEPNMLAHNNAENRQYSKYTQNAFKAYMETVQANLEPRMFPTSENVVQQSFCTVTGLLAGPGCPTATGYYTSDNVPVDVCTGAH